MPFLCIFLLSCWKGTFVNLLSLSCDTIVTSITWVHEISCNYFLSGFWHQKRVSDFRMGEIRVFSKVKFFLVSKLLWHCLHTFLTSQPFSNPTKKLALPIDSLSKIYQEDIILCYLPQKIGLNETNVNKRTNSLLKYHSLLKMKKKYNELNTDMKRLRNNSGRNYSVVKPRYIHIMEIKNPENIFRTVKLTQKNFLTLLKKIVWTSHSLKCLLPSRPSLINISNPLMLMVIFLWKKNEIWACANCSLVKICEKILSYII